MGFGVILVATSAILFALTAPQFHYSTIIQVKSLQPPLVVGHGDLLQLSPHLLCPLKVAIHDVIRQERGFERVILYLNEVCTPSNPR